MVNIYISLIILFIIGVLTAPTLNMLGREANNSFPYKGVWISDCGKMTGIGNVQSYNTSYHFDRGIYQEIQTRFSDESCEQAVRLDIKGGTYANDIFSTSDNDYVTTLRYNYFSTVDVSSGYVHTSSSGNSLHDITISVISTEEISIAEKGEKFTQLNLKLNIIDVEDVFF